MNTNSNINETHIFRLHCYKIAPIFLILAQRMLKITIACNTVQKKQRRADNTDMRKRGKILNLCCRNSIKFTGNENTSKIRHFI